jgi:dTDP-4-dehydrorhamnose 3,5-epimerase
MQVRQTGIAGVLLFVPTPHHDDRGWFSRTFDANAARTAGLDPGAFVQDSQSRSRKGVIRGLHGRLGRGEAKFVRCSSGALFDVVVDARPDSPTFGRWAAFQLDDLEMHGLYIPRGLLHGFQALTETADTCYRIDAEHDPAEDVAVRFDDPQLAIPWPLPPTLLSDRDRSARTWADLQPLLKSSQGPHPSDTATH